MSKLGERAAALAEREDSLRTQIHAVLAEAGGHLLTAPKSPADSDLTELRTRENDVSEHIAGVETNLERIATIEDSLAESKKRAADIQAQIKTLSDGLDPIYEEVGQIALDVYRGNPLVDQVYADIFAPLIELTSEIAGIDAAVAEQQAQLEDKPFLEKMVIRGRIALLRNKKTTREGSFRRFIRTAGRDIMATDFVDEIADPALSSAASPFMDRLARTRELQAELDTLTAERATFNGELEQLGAAKRTERRAHELQSDVVTLVQSRDAIRAEIATVVRADSDAAVPAKVTEFLAKASELENQIKSLGRITARINAGLKAEQLETEAGKLRAEIERKENRQAELKKELTALRREVKSVESDLEAAAADRGSLDELLAPELLDNF